MQNITAGFQWPTNECMAKVHILKQCKNYVMIIITKEITNLNAEGSNKCKIELHLPVELLRGRFTTIKLNGISVHLTHRIWKFAYSQVPVKEWNGRVHLKWWNDMLDKSENVCYRLLHQSESVSKYM